MQRENKALSLPVDMDIWLAQFYASNPALPLEFLADRQDALPQLPQEREWL
jgi:hypothetical protein